MRRLLIAALAALVLSMTSACATPTQQEDEAVTEETTEAEPIAQEEEPEETTVTKVKVVYAEPEPVAQAESVPASAPIPQSANTPVAEAPTSTCHQDRSACDESLPGIPTEREMEAQWEASGRPSEPMPQWVKDLSPN